MSDKFRLKAPEDYEFEYISQSSFGVEVKPGGEVEVENPQFADWLIRVEQFTLISAPDVAEPATPAAPAQEQAADKPAESGELVTGQGSEAAEQATEQTEATEQAADTADEAQGRQRRTK